MATAISTRVDTCSECPHGFREHLDGIGCTHALDIGNGERMTCICPGYSEAYFLRD